MEELLLYILNLLWEIFGELLLQVLAQLAVELFSRLLRALMLGNSPTAVESRPDPIGLFIMYTVLGGLMGVVSLKLLPQHMIHSTGHRWLNLIVTPLLMGWAMAALGAWQDRHGRNRVGMDKFCNGWGFALALAAVRFGWCR
jgi:hypothetical protein